MLHELLANKHADPLPPANTITIPKSIRSPETAVPNPTATVHGEISPDSASTTLPNAVMTASPRSSESAEPSHSPKTPSSPFLHNLHHRFRKGSNASSSVSSETHTPQEPADRAEAVQSARRFLLATIRNDWEWPPQVPETKPETKEEVKKDGLLDAREPIAWRSRLEGQSDIDLDSDASASGRKKRRKNSDPYRFENPDAIATALLEKKLKRKRKVEAEVEWNEGLRLWCERRDAWTNAAQTMPKHSSGEMTADLVSDSSMQQRKSSSISLTQSRRGSQASQPTESTIQALANGEASDSSSWPLPVESDPNAPYLPVYAPLFSTSHALRSRIKPPAYPTIYSKVVLQSLTPNVPIPLPHMIGALVEGWKAEGNWPPEAAVAEAAETLRQRRRGRGEGAFARWRREQDEKRRLKRLSTETNGVHGQRIFPEDGDLHERRGFRRHLAGAVKKVFGKTDEEDDDDGGLERMGVKFLDGSLSDEVEANGVAGLMDEAKDIQEQTVSLNKSLLETAHA